MLAQNTPAFINKDQYGKKVKKKKVSKPKTKAKK